MKKGGAALVVCLLWPGLALAGNAPGPDAFGYTVASTTNFGFLQITNGSTRTLWFVDDAAVTNAPIGFNFNFYGAVYSNVSYNSNGLITFGGASIAYSNVNLTTTSPQNNLPSIAALWDDWQTLSPGSDGVYYKTIGTVGSRQFIVQWNKVIPVNGSGTNAVTFESRLLEGSNQILFSYLQVVIVETGRVASLGAGATVGIRDINGQTNNRNLQWSYNQPVITNGLNLLFTPPASGPMINAATISPSVPTTTNTLLAVMTSATDPSGLAVNYAYQWQQSADNTTFTNLIGQTLGTLSPVWTIAGDYYRVVITPSDSLTNGAPFTTASVHVPVDADGNGINDDWELQYFGHIGVNPNADFNGTGFTVLQDYLAGTDPTNNTWYFHIISVVPTGNDVRVTWMMGPGKTNALQATGAGAPGSYSTNNFTSIFTVTNTVGTSTNYLDVGGATNRPSRYYRIRLVP